jgi:hypothetical protein
MNHEPRQIPILVALFAALTGGAACTVTTTPQPTYAAAPAPAYAEGEGVPTNIETYPNTVYEGHPVYFYNDRWYYRHGQRWTYYQREPDYLVRQRTVVRQAPPAPVRESPAGAPPAIQVR